jgi:NAD(P)-dependent dehydrogenase (short-subunit alcohol dehydrogenase family)
MTSKSKNRVAVVTGGAQGFGRAISIGLAKSGVDIVSIDLTESKDTVKAVEEAGSRGVSMVADVADPGVSNSLATLLEEEFGRVDVLVNNAGIYPNVPFEDVDYALWKKVHSINLDSQFFMVKGVLPLMKQSAAGRIVNITSNSIGLPIPGLSHYMASKMGVIGFTRGLSADLAEYGITVNAVGPTASKTPGGIANIEEHHIEQLAQSQAIKRAGTAEDIVGTVLFLAGESSAWVTGQTIMADGGLVRL